MANVDYVHNFDLTTGQVNRNAKDAIIPRFFIIREPNPKTGAMDETEYVELRNPGDRLTVRRPKVEEEHRRRWPDHYRAFKLGLEPPVNGHALNKWPDMSEHTVAEFVRLNINTIEALASATDQAIGSFQGGFGWRKRAQVYLKELNEQKAVDKDAVIAQLQSQVAQLMEAQRGAVSVPSGGDHVGKPRRGRPPGKKSVGGGQDGPSSGMEVIRLGAEPQAA